MTTITNFSIAAMNTMLRDTVFKPGLIMETIEVFMAARHHAILDGRITLANELTASVASLRRSRRDPEPRKLGRIHKYRMSYPRGPAPPYKDTQ